MARLLDQQDGLGVYSRQLLQRLFAIDPQSRYVVFLGSRHSQTLFDAHPNVSTCVLTAPGKLWWDQVLVPRAARRLGVDLIFNPKFSLPLLTAIPGVFVLQSCDWYVNPGNYPWWDNLYIRLTLPLYCRKAHGLLGISRSTLEALQRHTGLALAGAAVTHAGVGPTFTAIRNPTALEKFRQKHSLPERYILTVARVLHTGHATQPEYPGGNNERLVRAYLRYRGLVQRPLPLVIAGRGVEQYLAARGFSRAQLHGVHFLGYVPNDEMHMAYQLADCFVLATLCESFGIPILEALATGCPAIVPKTGAAPEVAGSAARFIDPYSEQDIAQALLEVTQSAPLREYLGQEGIKRARAFSWQHAAQQVLEVFDSILPATRAPVSAAHT